ncbi:hypothetical protein WICMUC_000241 [Wickerhamomyces mucosus]|uniref:Leucine aminopeptidase 2 n=1 Tax=Wickerhamomyces mucosus TaxID=1378264 RepID=A0A9P8PXX5_9ASCO|nr:hypothetical protein WICMUC_000241 [Wickerhamomyces mucosus]
MSSLPKVIQDRRHTQSPEIDHSTLSNYKNFKVTNTHLNIELQFDTKKIVGLVTYNLNVLQSVSKIILDSSFLKINSIAINDKDIKSFKINEREEPRGSSIEIDHQVNENDELNLTLNFETTDKSTAIQWLKTESNTPDSVDYIFTQLEPNHARSLLPSFDTPGIKSTFTAEIKSKYPVVFSGLSLNSSNVENNNVYKFEQTVPIPSYLIAIASGNITSAKIGPRSTVYAELSVLESAKEEFSQDIERFIQVAEEVAGPYIWKTYDFLINPFSFPYGGMENPNITFLTPTLISGDKSQINVIAHELAHSWSGNNVTNASWEHFWLNEGWTVYLERRIGAKLHPEPEKFRSFEYLMGWNDLVESIKQLPKFEYSRLIQDLQNGKIDPDDTFSSVPYEKGANFIYHLETKLGGLEEFDPYIKFYFNKFSKQSIDSYQFIDSLYEFYPQKKEILDNIDWELWLYTPGLPPKADFDTEFVDKVTTLTKEWISKANVFQTVDEFKSHFTQISLINNYNEFTTEQKIYFIDTLLEPLESTPKFWSENSIASDSILSIYQDLETTKNTEIKTRLFKFKLNAKKTKFYQDLADWLGTVGRMKYVRPGYKLLFAVDQKLAIDTFNKYKDFYHPIASKLVEKDLGLSK